MKVLKSGFEEHQLTIMSKQAVYVSKLCEIFFVAGVVFGYSLRLHVGHWT